MCNFCSDPEGSVYNIKVHRHDTYKENTVGEICESCLFDLDESFRGTYPPSEGNTLNYILKTRNREDKCSLCGTDSTAGSVIMSSIEFKACSAHLPELRNLISVTTPA